MEKKGNKYLGTVGSLIMLIGKLILLLTWTLTRVLEMLLRFFNDMMEVIFKK